MYPALKTIHSILALVFLLALLLIIIYALIGWAKGNKFTEGSRKFALYGLILSHIQLLIGLIIYFVSPLGFSNFSGEAMGNSLSRLYMLEHPLINIIGIVLITIGYSKAKKSATDTKKFKLIAIFYGVGLILILSRIPWAAWVSNL